MDAFLSLDDFFSIHPFHETANALGVAITTAIKLYVVDLSVHNFKLDHLTAGALRIIGVFHEDKYQKKIMSSHL